MEGNLLDNWLQMQECLLANGFLEGLWVVKLVILCGRLEHEQSDCQKICGAQVMLSAIPWGSGWTISSPVGLSLSLRKLVR